MSRLSILRVLPVLLLASSLFGCGGSNANRVSGKVTFAGKPVPAGKIYFMPDGGKNNSGATAYAEIIDGFYDTSATGGQGATKGPMIVAIEGIDPATAGKKEKGDTSGEETTKSLFPRFETTVELPGSAATKDFDVPADAVKGPKKTGPTIIVP